MKLHSSTNLWDYLKAVLFMLKIKSLISKKKFQMDVNLFMKRGKLIGKSITNLLTITRHHSHCNSRSELVSINPVNLHAKRGQNKRGYLNFPCIKLNESVVEGKEVGKADSMAPLCLEFTSEGSSSFSERKGGSENGGDVDCDADEFIRRFYEQLKGETIS